MQKSAYDHLSNFSTHSYTIKFFNLQSTMSCGSAVLPVTACFSGQCSYVHNLFEYCPHSTSVNVTLMASNTLVDGRESKPTTITVVSGLLYIHTF